jgi:hypothetical protein
LGEFSPFGWLLTLGSFFENDRSSANLWIAFHQMYQHVLILTKMGWAHFGRKLTTHLVTLHAVTKAVASVIKNYSSESNIQRGQKPEVNLTIT